MISHGTTLHGAEALNPAFRCHPLVYYTPRTPIGQAFRQLQALRPSLNIGVVGLGAGSVAAYVRPTDRLTFFEIDPLIARVAHQEFAYLDRCAKGSVGVVLGDARLTLERQPEGAFDLLLLDAVSADAVPTHLLTVEALREDLARLNADGVLVLHLSNRNLELLGPAMATARAAGGLPLVQRHRVDPGDDGDWESAEDAVIVAKTPAGLAPFAADDRWSASAPRPARPWTDDYVNLAGALWARLTGS
jgi:hypothetical protein